MENLSINNLFPDAEIKKDLDIQNLLKPSKPNEFNYKKLIKTKEQKISKLKNAYKNILQTCLEKIEKLNEIGEEEFVFEVPKTYFMLNNYSPINCLEYIEKKLRKEYIDTYIIDNYNIFISWKDIESNEKLGRFINF